MATYTDEEMTHLWRRAEAIDRLSRDEFPWPGWDKEFPDLVAQRKADFVGEEKLSGVADQLVKDLLATINHDVQPLPEMPYARQYVLETVIGKLTAAV